MNTGTMDVSLLDWSLSDNPDSYRYLEPDSWLFDYTKKKAQLAKVFDKVLFLDYNRDDMVRVFMDSIGYPPGDDTTSLRLNPTV